MTDETDYDYRTPQGTLIYSAECRLCDSAAGSNTVGYLVEWLTLHEQGEHAKARTA